MHICRRRGLDCHWNITSTFETTCTENKTTQNTNLTYVMTWLWVKSDPKCIIKSAKNKTKCSFCSNEHNVNVVRSRPQKQEQVQAFHLSKTSSLVLDGQSEVASSFFGM